MQDCRGVGVACRGAGAAGSAGEQVYRRGVQESCAGGAGEVGRCAWVQEVQNSFRDADGNLLRPDVIIQLPDEKHIVIDSKVSLKAFEQYINADFGFIRSGENYLEDDIPHLKMLRNPGPQS